MEASVKEIRMNSLRFVPVIRIGASTIVYKELNIRFESLPIELQEQIKSIAFERVSSELKREADRYERANNGVPPDVPCSQCGNVGIINRNGINQCDACGYPARG